MKKEELKKLIDTAAGRIPADTVIKNCQIVNVFSGKIQTVFNDCICRKNSRRYSH